MKKNQTNFYNIHIFILEFLAIFSEILRIFEDFSSQKTNLFEYFWDWFAILSTF